MLLCTARHSRRRRRCAGMASGSAIGQKKDSLMLFHALPQNPLKF